MSCPGPVWEGEGEGDKARLVLVGVEGLVCHCKDGGLWSVLPRYMAGCLVVDSGPCSSSLPGSGGVKYYFNE